MGECYRAIVEDPKRSPLAVSLEFWRSQLNQKVKVLAGPNKGKIGRIGGYAAAGVLVMIHVDLIPECASTDIHDWRRHDEVELL